MIERWEHTPSGSPRVVYERNGREAAVIRYSYVFAGHTRRKLCFRVFFKHNADCIRTTDQEVHDIDDDVAARELAQRLVMA